MNILHFYLFILLLMTCRCFQCFPVMYTVLELLVQENFFLKLHHPIQQPLTTSVNSLFRSLPIFLQICFFMFSLQVYFIYLKCKFYTCYCGINIFSHSVTFLSSLWCILLNRDFLFHQLLPLWYLLFSVLFNRSFPVSKSKICLLYILLKC